MFFRSLTPLAVLFFVAGCSSSSSTPSATSNPASVSAKSHRDEPGQANHKDGDAAAGHTHTHERGKMLIADAGQYHALLTAHLSKDGNELDIFFETPVTKNPLPVAIAIESFDAQATAGDGESQMLTFEPAPAEERPADEKSGTYSHFIAKALWMKPEDDLLVVARLIVDGKEIVARWKNFKPIKFAHHVE